MNAQVKTLKPSLTPESLSMLPQCLHHTDEIHRALLPDLEKALDYMSRPVEGSVQYEHLLYAHV